MFSLGIPLRQKYSLSFFITTWLIALTTESSLAFSIGPINVTPKDTEVSYTLPDQRKGIVKWNPLNLKTLPRGGTIGLLERLKLDFPTWTFNPAPNDLVGSFRVERYTAEYLPETEKFAPGVGARLRLKYDYGNDDPKPEDSDLHWIQRVVSNHDIRKDIKADEGHGINANIIDNKSRDTDPFYDTAFLKAFDEKSFRDFPKREADQNHTWLAELYLVNKTAPNQVTIYNGIQWGWENNVESVPEPLTILGAGISLGFGVLFKKTYSKK
jgi:hypothetical protein